MYLFLSLQGISRPIGYLGCYDSVKLAWLSRENREADYVQFRNTLTRLRGENYPQKSGTVLSVIPEGNIIRILYHLFDESRTILRFDEELRTEFPMK